MLSTFAEFERYDEERRLQGRNEGLREGRNEGLREGLREGQVAAVLDLCELLGLPLSSEQRAALERMDLPDLCSLRAHLKQHRAWPVSPPAC